MTPLECEIIVGSIPAGAISRKGGSIWGMSAWASRTIHSLTCWYVSLATHDDLYHTLGYPRQGMVAIYIGLLTMDVVSISWNSYDSHFGDGKAGCCVNHSS